MSDSIQLYTIYFTSPEFKYLKEYLSSADSPALSYSNRADGFLAIADEYGYSNKHRIFDTYTPAEKIQYADSDSNFLLLKIGTKFVIPADQIQRNALLTEGIPIITNSDVTFKAKALAALEADAGYVQIEKPINGQITKGITKEYTPEISVWIWCRALSDRGTITQEDFSNYVMSGEIFDLSPFISNLTTNVTRQTGGNFQFTLPPLVASLDSTGKWVVEKDSIQMYANPKNLSLNEQGYVAEASLYDVNMQRKQFLFHNIISSNDLVFIRFEKLEMERNSRGVNDSLNIDRSQLAGNIYDMIGLVDLDGSSVNPASNDANITITGRDLSKIFIEDGTYFYALEQSGILKFAGASTQKNSLLQRVFSDNALLYFSLYFNNSIENAFKFVIQQLSTISVVPDDLFISYGDRRGKRKSEGDFYKGKLVSTQIKSYTDNAKDLIKTLINKVYFLSIGIDSVLDANQVSLSQLSDILSDKNINNTFVAFKDFFNSIRKNKVRQTESNITSGWDTFTWNNPLGKPENIAENTLPDYFGGLLYQYDYFSTSTISDDLANLIIVIDNLLDIDNSVSQYKKEFTTELATGIWQIVNLVIDKNVAQRRLVDSSMSSANGSLINFFKKICQEPFVEFIMDTYSDTYNITVRKPPTDQIGLISLLEGTIITEDGKVQNGKPAVIDIYPEDVLKEDLYFDDRDVYSWYHLTPRYQVLGDETYTYFYLPALYFEEYASIWGSRPMDISHNYSVYQPLDPSSGHTDDPSEKQAAYDLKYMVESNQANPFTRKGSITLNGDRRLKVGNAVRYHATGEIFFIDAVQNGYKIGTSSIGRTTTISVSRGMIEQLIYGIPVTGSGANQSRDVISYFNIINTDLEFTYKKVEDKKIVEDVSYKYPEAQNNYSIAPGFNEYMQHQQGAAGMAEIVRAAFTGNFASQKRYEAMRKNIYSDYPGGTSYLTPAGFIEYWVKKYNAAYALMNTQKTQFDKIYAQVSVDTSVPFVALKTFGQLESKNTNAGANKYGYVGVMQLSDDVAKAYGVTDRTDPKQSITGAAKYYLANTKNKLFTTQDLSLVPEKVITQRTVVTTSTVLDREGIFKNFKVNRHVFNFFLRRGQFDKAFNNGSLNTTIYNANVAQALGRDFATGSSVPLQGVTVTAKKNK